MLFVLNNSRGGAVLIFVLGIFLVTTGMLFVTISAPQSNLRASARLYDQMILVNEIMEDLRTRVTCVGQHYNPDRAAGTFFSCTPGNVISLYGQPSIILFGSSYPSKVLPAPSTVLPSSKGRPVRAVCMGQKKYRIEMKNTGATAFSEIGAIECP